MRPILLLLTGLLLAAWSAPAAARDIYRDTPPAGWARQEAPSYRAYTHVDPYSGGFCVIGAYASTPGSGDADTDFANEWQTLVQGSLSLPLPRKVHARDWEHGWQRRSGSAQVDSRASGRYTTTLIVHSGPRRAFSILVKESREACGGALREFLDSTRLTEVADARPRAEEHHTRAPEAIRHPQGPAEPAAAGERINLNGLEFPVPQGWKLLPQSAFAGAQLGLHAELQPQRLHEGENLTLILFPPAPPRGSLEDELQTGWQEVTAGLGGRLTHTVNGTRFDSRMLGREADHNLIAYAEGAIEMADGDYDLDLHVLRLQGQTVRVAAVAHWIRKAFLRTSALQNLHFSRQLSRLLLDLEVGGNRLGQAPERPADARPILGVWNGLSMFGGLIKEAYAKFYPDGRVYFASNPPMQGFLDLDSEADALRRGFYWGSYSFDGRRGEIRLPGRKAVYPMRRNGDALTVVSNQTPHDFIRLAPMDDYRLQGAYAFKHADGHFTPISFTADGRFNDAGALDLVDHDTYYFKVSKQPGAGRYVIRDYTLTLSYDDGRELRLPFLGSSDLHSSTPATLRLGTEDTELVRR